MTDSERQTLLMLGGISDRLARVETKLDALMGLPERVAKLENAHARLLGWAAAISTAASVVIAVVAALL